MIQLDPRDRRVHQVRSKRPLGATVVVMTVLFACLVGGYLYLRSRSTYSDVYKALGISPLPYTMEIQPQIYNRLDELSREPCYRDAIIGLSDTLIDAGYPRESATSLLAFAKHCSDSENEAILVRAYVAFKKIEDFPAALQVANRLVNADPANPQYRYSRGATYEQLKDFSGALADYIAALQLLGDPRNVVGDQFYDISRMYAALGRYCDAIAPIETYISYNPAQRRTPQTMQIISEYAKKGDCEARYARGVGHVPFLNATGVRMLPVIVNGVTGNFILDSGADLVAVTPEFSAKAKVKSEPSSPMPLKTAGGIAFADLGYADTISVGNAEAYGVAVAVIRDSKDPFGGHLDGLLGMTFLARFNLRISQGGVDLEPISLQ